MGDRHITIQELDLSRNQISMLGDLYNDGSRSFPGSKIFELLKQFTTLQKLDLATNHLNACPWTLKTTGQREQEK